MQFVGLYYTTIFQCTLQKTHKTSKRILKKYEYVRRPWIEFVFLRTGTRRELLWTGCPYKMGSFSTSWGTISFSRRTLFRGVNYKGIPIRVVCPTPQPQVKLIAYFHQSYMNPHVTCYMNPHVTCYMNPTWLVIWTPRDMLHETHVTCYMNPTWLVIWTPRDLLYELHVTCYMKPM